MLQQCANPTCTARFMYLHDGKLFVLEPSGTPAAGESAAIRRYFWLCNACHHDFIVCYERRKARVTVRRKTPSEYREMAA